MGVLEKLAIRNTKKPALIENELSILHSEVEYNPKSQHMSYMIFEIVRKDVNGNSHHLFKALRFMRLIRIPKNENIYNRLMEKHSEILSALWENQVHFVTLLANILESEPFSIGLLFSYGVQGVGLNIEEAKENCDMAYAGLADVLKGTYKTMEFRSFTHQETEWLRKKMMEMDNVSMLRGIPVAHASVVQNKFVPVDPVARAPSSHKVIENETMEEFVVGMSDYEYIYMSISTPIQRETLVNWMKLSAREATDWRKIMNNSFNVSFNMSLPLAFGGNIGANQGWGEGHSTTDSVGHGTSHTDTTGFSDGVTEGSTESHGTSEGTSEGTTTGTTDSTSQTHTDGKTHTDSTTDSETKTTGTTISDGTSNTRSTSIGKSESHEDSTTTVKTSENNKLNESGKQLTHQENSKESFGQSEKSGYTDSHTNKDYQGSDKSQVYKDLTGSKANYGLNVAGLASSPLYEDHSDTETNATSSGSLGDHTSGNYKQGDVGKSNTSDTIDGSSSSESSKNSQKEGQSVTHTVKEGVWSDNRSVTDAKGTSHTKSVSDATSIGKSVGSSDATSESDSYGTSHADSKSKSNGTNKGVSDSFAKSLSQSHTKTVSSANGVSDSTSKAVGDTTNISTGLSQGSSASMGVVQGLSISRGYNWIDTNVEDIVKMIVYQHERVVKALNGQGAFYVDTFVATKDKYADSSARALAKSAFMAKDAFSQPFQAISPEIYDQQKMLYHMQAFSPSLELEGIPGQCESYKWSTMLLPDELASMTHPCRISEGGLYADVEDMPRLSVPSDRQFGDVYVGNVLSAERYSEVMGHLTHFKFCLDSMELMHAIFQGESRSGKTVSAMRVVDGFSRVIRPSGKKLRIIAFDQKTDWRGLARTVDEDRFRFFTVAEDNELTLLCNLLVVPPNVYPEKWINLVAENFALHYKMNIKGIQIITKALFEVYEKQQCLNPNWRDVATENSRKASMAMVYDTVEKHYEEKKNARVGFNELDAYERVLQRLADFKNEYSICHKIFNQGYGIHEILGDDDITVIEAFGLKKEVKNFIFGVMFCGIYEYAINNGSFMSDDQYETIIVVEEANSVLVGQSGASSEGGQQDQSIFESIIDQSAGNGMYCFAVTQTLLKMPTSLRTNAGINFFGRTRDTDTIQWMVSSLGRNPRYEDISLANWFARMPDLNFVVRSSRTTDYKKSEPVHVLVDRLPIPRQAVTESELVQKDKLRKAKRMIV